MLYGDFALLAGAQARLRRYLLIMKVLLRQLRFLLDNYSALAKQRRRKS